MTALTPQQVYNIASTTANQVMTAAQNAVGPAVEKTLKSEVVDPKLKETVESIAKAAAGTISRAAHNALTRAIENGGNAAGIKPRAATYANWPYILASYVAVAGVVALFADKVQGEGDKEASFIKKFARSYANVTSRWKSLAWTGVVYGGISFPIL